MIKSLRYRCFSLTVEKFYGISAVYFIPWVLLKLRRIFVTSLYQILTFVSQFFSMSKFIKARNQTHNYYEIVDTKLLGNVKMSDNVVVVEDKFNSGLYTARNVSTKL